MQRDAGAPFASASGAVALNELFIFSAYITILLLLYLLYCYIVCLPFDYCGNLTTAHPVVKVCAADSPAILRFMIGAVSFVQLLAELSFHYVRLASVFMSTQGSAAVE